MGSSCCVQLLTLIPGWLCFFYLLNSMTGDAEIKGFDPFAILGVTQDTSEREIKKQYRALSLIYHPDKVGLVALPRVFSPVGAVELQLTVTAIGSG